VNLVSQCFLTLLDDGYFIAQWFVVVPHILSRKDITLNDKVAA
jgi:hypothetical protein